MCAQPTATVFTHTQEADALIIIVWYFPQSSGKADRGTLASSGMMVREEDAYRVAVTLLPYY